MNAEYEKTEAEAIALNSRCKLAGSQALGTVLFVGQVPTLAPGYWVGVNLDNAEEGSSNGSHGGQ